MKSTTIENNRSSRLNLPPQQELSDFFRWKEFNVFTLTTWSHEEDDIFDNVDEEGRKIHPILRMFKYMKMSSQL